MDKYIPIQKSNFKNRRFCYFPNFENFTNNFIQIDNFVIIQNFENKSLNFIGIVKFSKKITSKNEKTIGINPFMLFLLDYPKKVIVKPLIEVM